MIAASYKTKIAKFLFFQNQQGYGGLTMLLAAGVVAAVMFFLIFPNKFPHFVAKETQDITFCRPYVNDDGTIKNDAPEVYAPSYEYNANEGQFTPIIHNDNQPYRLIKANVPVTKWVVSNYFSPTFLHTQSPPTVKCSDFPLALGGYHHHFCEYIHEPYMITSPLTKADKYAVLYPATHAQSTGRESIFYDDKGVQHKLLFADYGIIFLLHLKNDLTTYDIPGLDYADPTDLTKLKPALWSMMDVYQQVREDNHTIPINRLPDEVLHCGVMPAPVSEHAYNTKDGLGPYTGQDKKELQLDWFTIEIFQGEFNWYYPSCKPAINLYPEKDTLVNVKVEIPNGFLTYTDPLYPKDTGWNVLAKPTGELTYLGNTFASSKGIVNYPTGVFPYLYYEGKVQDNAVLKPTQGFLKSYEQLSSFFDNILPKVGLNQKESTEFKEYWLKALPKSPYYFIGIIPQEELDKNEPLTITPKQDTTIRVRLYFEALTAPVSVTEPFIQTPKRSGFTVVDWGGMVKADKKHPFTCLQ